MATRIKELGHSENVPTIAQIAQVDYIHPGITKARHLDFYPYEGIHNKMGLTKRKPRNRLPGGLYGDAEKQQG